MQYFDKFKGNVSDFKLDLEEFNEYIIFDLKFWLIESIRYCYKRYIIMDHTLTKIRK